MFKILILVGIIFTGNIHYSAEESSGFSLEEGDDKVEEYSAMSQMPSDSSTLESSRSSLEQEIKELKESLSGIPRESVQEAIANAENCWKTALETYNCYDSITDEIITGKKNSLHQHRNELHRALGALESLRMKTMDTKDKTFTAYRYYKKVWLTLKKHRKETSSEES